MPNSILRTEQFDLYFLSGISYCISGLVVENWTVSLAKCYYLSVVGSRLVALFFFDAQIFFIILQAVIQEMRILKNIVVYGL